MNDNEKVYYRIEFLFFIPVSLSVLVGFFFLLSFPCHPTLSYFLHLRNGRVDSLNKVLKLFNFYLTLSSKGRNLVSQRYKLFFRPVSMSNLC